MYHQLLFDLVLLAILKTTAAGRNDGFCRLGCGSIENIGCVSLLDQFLGIKPN